MTNKVIRKRLVKERDASQKALRRTRNLHPLFLEALSDLEKFDFAEYKVALQSEIKKNLINEWTNPEQGIKKEEQLFAILFEYDNPFDNQVEAFAYGIGEWEDYQVETKSFDMGFNYDFTSEFYSMSGITVSFFNGLERLDHSNLPEELEDEDITDLKGFEELYQLHQFQGMIAIHDTLVLMDENKEFESLNYRNEFMFLIDEHDSGETFPLLIKHR